MHPLEQAALRIALSAVFLRVETVIYAINPTPENKDHVIRSLAALEYEKDRYHQVLATYPPIPPSGP
jgi:hypothetical protein